MIGSMCKFRGGSGLWWFERARTSKGRRTSSKVGRRFLQLAKAGVIGDGRGSSRTSRAAIAEKSRSMPARRRGARLRAAVVGSDRGGHGVRRRFPTGGRVSSSVKEPAVPSFGGGCKTLRPRSCAGPGERVDAYIIWPFAAIGAASYLLSRLVQARLHEVHTEDQNCFAWTWKFRGERACGEKRDVNRSKTQAIVR